MREIIITSSSNRSGGTRQAVYQAQGLSERGHDVALCLPHDSTLWELPNAASNPLWNMLPEDPAHSAEIQSLIRAYSRITNREAARALLALSEKMAPLAACIDKKTDMA